MKLLLTGCNGQVGFALQRTLAVLGEVVAVDANQCNLAHAAAIRQLVRAIRPDAIIHPAAYTAVDQAEREPDLAYAINAHAPAVLAEEAHQLGALLVYYSTDYVFDGSKTGAYRESDTPHPINTYGASKLAGEQAVAASCMRYLIVRTSWVVGTHGDNFAKTMLRLACERDVLHVVADQFGAPTSAVWLAELTAQLVRQAQSAPQDFPYGLYHAAATGETSWHAYACYVIERARQAHWPIRTAPASIHPIPASHYSTAARRPAHSRLDSSLLQHTFGLHPPHWQAGLDPILEQVLYHHAHIGASIPSLGLSAATTR